MKDYEIGFTHALLFGVGLITALVFFSLIPVSFSENIISLISLIIAAISLGFSFYFWRRSFRPIVSAMVKTVESGNMNTMFDLEVANTGTIPAKDIRLQVKDEDIKNALGQAADEESKRAWLSCFNQDCNILILHNNSTTTCSFGYCGSVKNNKGFWKYNAIIPITIKYQGWFGKKYVTNQNIQITDSKSFTTFRWEKNS